MPKRLRIFISSPMDVRQERLRAGLVIDKLSQDFGRFVTLESYRWESEAMLASGHFQDSIEPPSRFDIVVLILWSRLGTPLPERSDLREYKGRDGRVPITGTEWEFEDALEAARAKGAPDILAFRNVRPAVIDTLDPVAQSQAIAQLAQLNSFWTKHFADRGVFLAAFETYRTIDEFSARFEGILRKLIEHHIARSESEGGHEQPLWLGDPFRGLQAYEFEHELIFFGRHALAATALEQLSRNAADGPAFLLVSGASGSGKSSLVKAGMVPRLTKPQRVPGVEFLRRFVFRPSDAHGEIVEALLAALAGGDAAAGIGLPELLDAGRTISDMGGELRVDAGGAASVFGTALGLVTAKARRAGRLLPHEEAKLILLVDQLEELFTIPTIADEAKHGFIKVLASLARSGAVWVIATMRSDFWHRVSEFNELIALCADRGRIEIGPPTRAELGEIIRKPAEISGLRFDVNPQTDIPLDAILAEQADAAPGVLPLLSFVLDALFNEDVLKKGGRTLTYATFETLGGLEGAIANRAEVVVTGLPTMVQASLPKVLRALAAFSRDVAELSIARSVPIDDFAPGSPERQIVDALVEARLLVARSDGAAPLVRIAHEALLRRWKRASDQLAADRRDLQTRTLLEEQMARWSAATGRTKRQLLLRNPDLALGVDLDKRWGNELPAALRDYIKRSYEAAIAALRLQWAIAAAVMICLTALSVASFSALYIALLQRTQALTAETRFLSRDSRNVTADGHGTLGMILALAGLPTALDNPDRPYIRHGGYALENAYANHRERVLLKGHTATVWSAAVSPSGTRVATAAGDKTARLWDASTGALVATLAGHDDVVWAVQFSPDGQLLATASDDGTARVWNAQSGEALAVLKRHTAPVTSVAFSPNSALVATIADDDTARLWEARTGRHIAVLAHSGLVNAIAFSSDGQRLATGSADKSVRLWDAGSGNLQAELKGHDGLVSALVFSRDGKRLVSGSWDKTARIWDAVTGQSISVLRHHQAMINFVDISYDGRRIVTASADSTALLCDAASGARLFALLHNDHVNSAVFTQDGSRVLTASEDGMARLWEVDSGRLSAVLVGHEAAVNTAVLSPAGDFIVTASSDGTARIWEAETWAAVGTLRGHTHEVESAVFSADGERIATTSFDNSVRVWDAHTMRPLKVLNGHTAKVYMATFSPDGRRLISVSADKTARIWDPETGAPVGTLTGHTEQVNSADYSPDGTRIVTTSKDTTARIWDAATNATVGVLSGHQNFVSWAVFSPDGKQVVTSSWDKTVRLWSVESRREVVPAMQHRGRVSMAKFSSDGERIWTTADDKSVRVWDASTGALMTEYADNPSTLQTLALSPDGMRLVAPAWDGTVQIWDTDGNVIAWLRGHTARVNSAAFSPDGTKVVSGSWDHTARVWRLPPRCQSLIDAAKAALPRAVTQSEKTRFFLGDRPVGNAALTLFKRVFAPILPQEGESCR